MIQPQREWIEVMLRDLGRDLLGLPYHNERQARLSVLLDVAQQLARAASMVYVECSALIAEEKARGNDGAGI